MYSTLNILLEACSAMFQGYCLQYFYGSFLESRFKSKCRTGAIVTILYGLLRIGMNAVLPSDYGSVKTITRLILTFCILSALAFGFYRAAKAITAYLIVVFAAVNEISFFLAYMVLMMGGSLIDILVWGMNNGISFFAGSLESIARIAMIVSQFLMYTAFVLLLHFTFRKIVREFREKDYLIQKTELLFLLTPAMSGLFICVLLRIIIIAVENGVSKLLYDKYPVLLIVVPVILLLSLLSILYGVKLFQDMIYLNMEKSSRIVLEKQVAGLREHMEEMERIHSGIRGMKHDMTNTLSVIMRLAAVNGETENEELQAYLGELNRSMDRLDFRFKTGNGVADSLLNMKYYELIRDVPDIEVDADRLFFPDNLVIHGYDIGIILGNALDNAAEACRKLKEKEPSAEAFVRLSSFNRGRMFFIDIENSFDGKLKRKQQAEFPITDKKDGTAHGMGLINIKNAVEKYHGAVDWSVHHNVFTLSIMMKNERSNEDGFWNSK